MEQMKENKQQRTGLLWVLAIFTMINAGIQAVNYLTYMLFPQVLRQAVEVMQNMPMFKDEQFKQVFEVYLSVERWQYGLLFLVAVATFAGALIMLWKLKKIGFHIYTMAQIFGFVVLNFVIGGKMAMDFNSVMWTVLIIVMYATQLRFMSSSQEDDEPIEEVENIEETEDIDNNE